MDTTNPMQGADRKRTAGDAGLPAETSAPLGTTVGASSPASDGLAAPRTGRDRPAAGRGGDGASDSESTIDPEERRRLINEAAYRNFERRNQTDGGDLDDWLAAEQEIDRTISQRPGGAGAP